MLRFLADENFNAHIVYGLQRRLPTIDIVRVQDLGVGSPTDSTVLELAAGDSRLLLTHDARTLIKHAYERVDAGLPMPGVIEAELSVPIAVAIDDLMLIAECGEPDEFREQVIYLPL